MSCTDVFHVMDRQPHLPLRCRLFGHKWQPCHRVDKVQPYGLLAWVYCDDVCKRCATREYRMPTGDSYQEWLPKDPFAKQSSALEAKS